MRFLLLLATLVLFSCVMTKKIVANQEEEETDLSTYFHKKMCYCVRADNGLCERLKCCDVYRYVPYRVVLRMCRYGNCQFVNSEESEEYPEEEGIITGSERESELGH
eukprot:TRINITY_DN385_c0_g2_i10.p2 TRINITY_DN385_c0_g2~~TRINITY_DN385_c0_g2_i10.p2  ORF type:complete len:107 (+),score=24.52 TRINITY_DN385_c0_g2_i10:290-610(+)